MCLFASTTLNGRVVIKLPVFARGLIYLFRLEHTAVARVEQFFTSTVVRKRFGKKKKCFPPVVHGNGRQAIQDDVL